MKVDGSQILAATNCFYLRSLQLMLQTAVWECGRPDKCRCGPFICISCRGLKVCMVSEPRPVLFSAGLRCQMLICSDRCPSAAPATVAVWEPAHWMRAALAIQCHCQPPSTTSILPCFLSAVAASRLLGSSLLSLWSWKKQHLLVLLSAWDTCSALGTLAQLTHSSILPSTAGRIYFGAGCGLPALWIYEQFVTSGILNVMQIKCKKCLVKVAVGPCRLMIYARSSGSAARQRLVFTILAFNSLNNS